MNVASVVAVRRFDLCPESPRSYKCFCDSRLARRSQYRTKRIVLPEWRSQIMEGEVADGG
jgi:hypothetical protein